MIFGLKFLNISPLMAGGGEGVNPILVYSLFVSFLENVDIGEFSKFWDIVHMGMINVFSFL